MAIRFNCVCGKTLRVGDGHAGKRVRCPVCQHIKVAKAEPEWELVEDEPPVASRFVPDQPAP
jgi:hypothetical protein